MKKAMALVLIGLALAVTPAKASAHEYNRTDSDYPLRYVAYLLNPIGMAVEYAVFRPIHYVVSQPGLCIVFGHEPREPEGYDYMQVE